METQYNPATGAEIPAARKWKTAEGSYGRYVSVVDESGRTVCRIPWGAGDNDKANLIAAAPDAVKALKALLPEYCENALARKEAEKFARQVIASSEGRAV